MALVLMYFKCVKGKLGTVKGKPGNSRSAFCCANRASPGASAGILNVGCARRRWVCLSRIPNLNHQLAMVVRIGGEDLRPRSIDPVVGQRANRVGPARTREAKHGAHDRRGS